MIFLPGILEQTKKPDYLAIAASFDSFRLLHFDASDLPLTEGQSVVTWTSKTNSSVFTTVAEGNPIYSNNSVYYNGASAHRVQGSGSLTTSFPIYFLVIRNLGANHIISKNNSQANGATASGRYLALSVGRFSQTDSLFTSAANTSVNTVNYRIVSYCRMSNLSTQQRKRHFVNTILPIENQVTISYTSNTDLFLIGAAFSGLSENINAYIQEIILYDGSTFSDSQRNSLVTAQYYNLKSKWNL